MRRQWSCHSHLPWKTRLDGVGIAGLSLAYIYGGQALPVLALQSFSCISTNGTCFVPLSGGMKLPSDSAWYDHIVSKGEAASFGVIVGIAGSGLRNWYRLGFSSERDPKVDNGVISPNCSSRQGAACVLRRPYFSPLDAVGKLEE